MNNLWYKFVLSPEVVSIATQAMFQNHFYTFGGEVFHQRQGGPIGLRGTCAIARVVMQLFDDKWGRKLHDLGLKTFLRMRYVDDTRVFMPPRRPGWRWTGGSLKYRKTWELEDQGTTGEERTVRIMMETMKGIEEYLEFTSESGLDFEDGWIPTLDASLKVGEDNVVKYRYFEKSTTTNKTVQKTSAMEENAKMKIIAQDLVRRLTNTKESLGYKEKCKVVDMYAKKLLNSGYGLEQVKKTLVSGIKGYENKKLRCKKEGWRFRRTAVESAPGRARKKLLS